MYILNLLRLLDNINLNTSFSSLNPFINIIIKKCVHSNQLLKSLSYNLKYEKVLLVVYKRPDGTLEHEPRVVQEVLTKAEVNRFWRVWGWCWARARAHAVYNARGSRPSRQTRYASPPEQTCAALRLAVCRCRSSPPQCRLISNSWSR